MVYRLLACLSLLLLLSSCISVEKTTSREAALNTWVSNAEKPIRVINQTFKHRCAPGYNCYTLIDNNGQSYYVKNVRVRLPSKLK